MRIALACNRKNGCGHYLSAEYDSASTIQAVSDVLSRQGYRVHVVEADLSAWDFFCGPGGETDLVFNIAEGIPSECREAQIPALLDLLDIPYTGPSLRTAVVCQDKHLTKRILRTNGIPTAPSFLYPAQAGCIGSLRFPVVIKPVHEGSSIGVTGEEARAADTGEALNKAERMNERFGQPVMVEEFLPGAEITAGVWGNREPEVLPLLELYTEMYPSCCRGMITSEAKTNLERDAFSGPPRKVPSAIQREVRKLARKVYRLVGCHDFGRIDFRIDRDGRPCVMEVNPIPGLNPLEEEVSYFPKMCRLAGIDYDAMISRIVDEATQRVGLVRDRIP